MRAHSLVAAVCAAVLLVVFAAPSADACPYLFGTKKAKAAPGVWTARHGRVMNAQQEAPEAPTGVFDNTNTSAALPLGGLTGDCLKGIGLALCDAHDWTWADFIDATVRGAGEPGKEYCYWSWQSLPPVGPWSPVRNSYNYTAIPDQVFDIVRMGFQAYNAFGTLNGSQPAWAGGLLSFGSDGVSYLCSKYPGALPAGYCRPEHYNQRLRFPVASAVLKFNGRNVEEVKSLIRTWRNGQQFHRPMIHSTAVQEQGWGSGGRLVFKIVDCGAIPPSLIAVSNASAVAVNSATGRAQIDEALQLWANIPGLQPTAQMLAGVNPPTSAPRSSASHRHAVALLAVCAAAAVALLVF